MLEERLLLLQLVLFSPILLDELLSNRGHSFFAKAASGHDILDHFFVSNKHLCHILQTLFALLQLIKALFLLLDHLLRFLKVDVLLA